MKLHFQHKPKSTRIPVKIIFECMKQLISFTILFCLTLLKYMIETDNENEESQH